VVTIDEGKQFYAASIRVQRQYFTRDTYYGGEVLMNEGDIYTVLVRVFRHAAKPARLLQSIDKEKDAIIAPTKKKDWSCHREGIREGTQQDFL